jgi:uncharacterized membrane protein (UPF0136 family)
LRIASNKSVSSKLFLGKIRPCTARRRTKLPLKPQRPFKRKRAALPLPGGTAFGPFWALTPSNTTGNEIMSTEGLPESHLPTVSDSQRPPGRHSVLLRIVGLIVVVCVVVAAWRIYQNQKQTAANSVSQAAALMSRPVPVQVTPVQQQPMPIFLTALGTVTPYMSVTVKARVSGELLPAGSDHHDHRPSALPGRFGSSQGRAGAR